MRFLFPVSIALAFCTTIPTLHAVTLNTAPSLYSVSEGVSFTIGNNGASDFLFNWTDPSGNPPASFSNIADPTLVLTLGQTYTFQRTSSAHPFAIMDNSAAAFMSGTDGNYTRTTSDSSVISAATFLTASPGTPGAAMTWNPNQLGDFWYTCTVTGHPGMAGKFSVVPEPSTYALFGLGFLCVVYSSRRVLNKFCRR
jgi:hypothetical protein